MDRCRLPGFPTPEQSRECNKDLRRFQGSTRAEMRRFFAKKGTDATRVGALVLELQQVFTMEEGMRQDFSQRSR